ncbi:amidase [Polaromonas sp. SM01]|uniref:amidase n=1 Tax=Polaromonas sp. SM01 TaxID=3085630 RepID=UPI0029819E19|nr:amidase [Polaromonas sp. SM01]MDW5442255.1 amidase [Polaromonas sp. SM01]
MSITFDDYRAFDAMGLAEAVRRGKLSRREVLEATLDRVAAVNPQVNAVTYLHEAAADEASSDTQAPFAGVPYFIKDLHAPVAGMPLSHGSRLFAGDVHNFDSETVTHLRRAGFVILGRTASSEFGMNASIEPSRGLPTRNPWNLAHTAGGSSGGAGAAVASGMLPASHATDSGGSIRIPAACNGLVGLKPTRGLIPTGPHRGEASHGLSHEHAVTRSVRDCAAILDVTAGPDIGAPYFTAKPAESYLQAITRPPGRLRIAFTTTTFDGRAVDAECRAAVENTVRLLQDLGHEVEERQPEFDGAALGAACGTLLLTGLAAHVAARETQLGRSARPDEMDAVVHAAIALGRQVTGMHYASRFAVINREVRRIGHFFESADIFITPTLAKPPVALGLLSMQTLSMAQFQEAMAAFCPFTGAFNATGQPAMSLPLHWSATGLPVGVQLVGRFGEDARLLQLAAQLEQATPWFQRTAAM